MSQPGSTLQVFTSKTPGKTKGTISLCTRDHLNAATATCLWVTDFGWVGPGESVARNVIQGSILTLQRNECMKRQEGDWIIFIDDDMVWNPDAVGRLVASWEEVQATTDQPVIMGALCHRRGVPYDPTLYMRERAFEGGYRILERWVDDIVEVDATGLAFVLIPVKALEAIVQAPWPPLERRLELDPPPLFRWTGRMGEDLVFMQEAKNAGCRVFVDTRIEIGHIAEVPIWHKDFLMQIAIRTPTEEKLVREMNDAMGLPTMSATEARSRLGWSR